MEITAEYKAKAVHLSANMTPPIMTAVGGYYTKILVCDYRL